MSTTIPTPDTHLPSIDDDPAPAPTPAARGERHRAAAGGALPDLSPRRAALVAGLAYIALFALAIFANFAVVERLVDPDDPAATLANLAADQQLVRWAIAAFVVIFALDVVVAWALHQLLRPHGESVSLLAAWLRLVYTVFLGGAVVGIAAALQLAGDADLTATVAADQRAAMAGLALDAFDLLWLVGLVCFGLHLVTIGVLLVRTDAGPGLLGGALVVAGAAYVFDTLVTIVYAGRDDHAAIFDPIVIVPAVVAELGFTIWLLRRGVASRA